MYNLYARRTIILFIFGFLLVSNCYAQPLTKVQLKNYLKNQWDTLPVFTSKQEVDDYFVKLHSLITGYRDKFPVIYELIHGLSWNYHIKILLDRGWQENVQYRDFETQIVITDLQTIITNAVIGQRNAFNKI